MNIEFKPFTIIHSDRLIEMVMDFYQESPEGEIMQVQKIRSTIEYLTSHPMAGEIWLIYGDKEIVGYSILIKYWSNEFGGIITYIDELYISNHYRNRKIGSKFIEFVVEHNKKEDKMIFLEVFPYNIKALELYKRQGFEPIKSTFMKKYLES